jgi:uncharacterized protein (TIGR03435 family)
MTRDRDGFEKTLYQHLGLFGSPSAGQLDASRARIRERLLARRGAAMSDPPSSRRASSAYAWRMGLAGAAAAALIVGVVIAPWRQTDWLATVEAADGSRYALEPNAVLRSTDAGGTMLTLKDGSRVEMRSQSELLLERAEGGIGIRLRTGGLIVDAARQHNGHLYVYTKEMTVAVVGTMFVVNVEESGSRVTVIEGEVRVREGTIETKLRPGEQVSTSPALARRPIKEEVGWSRHADAILASFARGMAATVGPLTPSAAAGDAFGAAGGQSQAAGPEFDEASIRQCDPDNLPVTPDGGRGGGANSVQLTPGRLRALCLTVATLVRTAYGYGPADLDFMSRGEPLGLTFGNVYGLGVEDGRRVRGGPDWVRSERYTISAVAGADVTPDAETLRGSMLQRLLERRFQLKAHIESEPVPAFALTVARGGLKMKPAAPGACEPAPGKPGTPPPNAKPMAPPRSFADVRRGQKPTCGMLGQRNGPNMVLVGGEVPLSALTGPLAFRLGGVRVLDKTGVADRFNFVLEFADEAKAPGVPAGDLHDHPEPSDIPQAATVFTALEEELGLKLEPDRAPREFIVIDSVERPSPN